jgi:hypothetical protein
MPALREYSQVVVKYRTYPPLIQERMLYTVNTRRREQGLEPIPPASPEYEAYISSPLRSPDLEATAAVRAAAQEEARIAKVAEEFEIIVQGAIQANAQIEYQRLLESTADSTLRPPPSATPALTTVYQYTPIQRVFELGSRVPFVQWVKLQKDPFLYEALSIIAHEFDSIDQWDTTPFRKLVGEVCALLHDDATVRAQIEERHAKYTAE